MGPRLASLLLVAALVAAEGAPVLAAAAEAEPPPRAQLRARRSVTLAAGLSGELARLPLREGDRAAEGSPVAAVECSPLQASRRVAEARVQGAKAKQRVNERLAELNQSSVLEVEVARAEAAVAVAELSAVDAQLRRCEIRAPYAGSVAAVHAHQHQYVREGEPLLELVDTESPEIEMVLPSRWLNWLKPGTAFVFTSEDLGKNYPARIDRVGGRVDPVSQTVRVIGRLEGKTPELLPGMSGSVRVDKGEGR